MKPENHNGHGYHIVEPAGLKPVVPKPVKHAKGEQNGWCGPAALSSLMGITAEEAAKRIAKIRLPSIYGPKRTPRRSRARNSLHNVVGAQTSELTKVLRDAGYTVVREFLRYERTFAQWDAERSVESRRRTYLVTSGSHFQVVKGDKLYDTRYQNGVPFSEAKYGRSKVVCLMAVYAPAKKPVVKPLFGPGF